MIFAQLLVLVSALSPIFVAGAPSAAATPSAAYMPATHYRGQGASAGKCDQCKNQGLSKLQCQLLGACP